MKILDGFRKEGAGQACEITVFRNAKGALMRESAYGIIASEGEQFKAGIRPANLAPDRGGKQMVASMLFISEQAAADWIESAASEWAGGRNTSYMGQQIKVIAAKIYVGSVLEKQIKIA